MRGITASLGARRGGKSGPSRTLARAAVVIAGLWGLLLLDLRGGARRDAPRVVRAFQAAAPLRAGAATADLQPPLPVVRAGYGMPRTVAEHERDPLKARALVLESGGKRLALVLVDLVLAPEELSRALEARLADRALDGLLLIATHTHSSVGGFDSRLIAQVVGTGRYRPDVVTAILSSAERAVRDAERDLVPVSLRTRTSRGIGWAGNRSSPGADIDDALDLVVFEAAGRRVATLAIVSAHPTLVERTSPFLSPDYPGVAMARLETGGGVALLLQGAAGDAALPTKGVGAVEHAGAAVAQAAAETAASALPVEPRLGFADAEVALPPAEPQAIRPFLLRRPAANLLSPFAPRTGRVSVVAIGDLLLCGVPGEPTALAARAIVDRLPHASAGRRARVVGLAGGYVGYVDAPERVRSRSGESGRMWFGVELFDAIRAGVSAAVERLGATPAS
jgi:neutral ceramidase